MAATLGNSIRRTISGSSPVFSAGGSAATAGGHGGGYLLWKRLSFFVALPAVGLCMLNAYLKHQEEHANYERPEFVAWEHLRLRNKRFPWGDGNKSLFHNPHTNALPTGYEDEGEHH